MVVASRTLFAQATLVHIVGLMAGITISLGILVAQGQMATLAGNHRVQPQQWKIRQVMIETHVATPLVSHMALIACVA